MTDFLFLLAKINLAMAGAIVMVALLRRPVRTAFHAPIAYALWLLVPVTVLASVLPPRAMTAAAQPVTVSIPAAFHDAPVHAVARDAQAAPFDWSVLLFAFWLAGLAAMLLVLAWQQRRFHRAEKMGAAGPAVTGFWRPRIVVPATFAAQFNVAEQAAILAHEAAHLARQDARINAVVAGLRCLCWFNPLVHLGALWLRKDQELACDASALRRVTRVDYANALLKSQMRALTLPLGCAWPSGEHPLTERVALLKRRLPGRARTLAGFGVITSLMLLAGIGAWAAQPASVQAASVASHRSLKESRWLARLPPNSPRIITALQEKEGGPTFMFTLQADRQENGPDRSKLWLGHVVMHLPSALVTADKAAVRYTAKGDQKAITFSGNVQVLHGLDFLYVRILTYDLGTAMLDLDSKEQIASGMPKYVSCTKNCKRY